MNQMKTITLANLAESTEQEVFDHVVAHARRQGVKSGHLGDYGFGDYGFVCMYRDEQNRSCFAGCLMTDQEYIDYDIKRREDITWTTMISDIGVSNNHSGLIRKMQMIHDQHEVYEWENLFRITANTFGLVYQQYLVVMTNL